MVNKSQKIKRLLDLTVSVLGLLFLFPLFAIISLTILLTMGKPIFFRQKRPGFLCHPFILVQFRTMREPREGGFLFPRVMMTRSLEPFSL